MARGAVRGRPGTRRDAWQGSWRVALLSARREVGRSRGRSLLILLLIGLPVFGLCATGVALASLSANDAESADLRLGQAAAVVVPAEQDLRGEFTDSEPVKDADGELFGQVARGGFASMDRQRPEHLLVADGFSRGATWTQERVEASIGAPVLPTAALPLTSLEGTDLPPTQDFERSVLFVNASDPLFEGSGRLVSGRWAAGPGEITVTEAGIDDGLPRAGRVGLTLADQGSTDLRVVGVARAQAGQSPAMGVMHPSAAPESVQWQWRVDRAQPVPLEEAQTWSDYGLSVMSRAVLLDPPPDDFQDDQAVLVSLIIAMLVLGVIIETMFLAGPAFAISTTRRQRAMALASAQGAGPADLRRQVLGYAVVLASLAAVVGAVLGIGTGLAVAAYLRRRSLHSLLPVEVPWLPLLGIVALAVLAAGLAAWWPARGVTHLDTMAVLRGRSVSRPVRRGMPAVGAVMVVVGAVLAVLGAGNPSGGEYALVAAGALMFFGAVLLIPLLLVVAGRVADRLPMAARLATRDATRQRGRSVPAVAAIAAAVALVAGLSTVVASSAVADRLNYEPQIAVGAAEISLAQYHDGVPEVTFANPATVGPALEVAVPAAQIWPVGFATTTSEGSGWREPTEGSTGTLWAFYAPDCSVEQMTIGRSFEDPCGMAANALNEFFGPGIAVVPHDALAATTGLDDAALEALEDKAVLVPQNVLPSAAPHTVIDAPTLSGEVTVASDDDYEYSLRPFGDLESGMTPAYVLEAAEFNQAFPSKDYAAVMTPEAAEAQGLLVQTNGFVVVTPGRALSESEAAAAATAVEEVGASFYVERGYQPVAETGIWIVLGALGLVALAATVIVTALTITDNARDSAVLAAVGGTSGVRRRWASSYALVIAGFGVALGMVIGIGMGLACGWWTTSGRWGFDGSDQAAAGVISVAWPVLGVLATLPLLGALIAWLCVRGTPHLLRPTV